MTHRSLKLGGNITEGKVHVAGVTRSDTGGCDAGHACNLGPMGWSFEKNRLEARPELFRHKPVQHESDGSID